MGKTVPSDGRLFWPGVVGSIPNDWTRDNDFNDKYFQGGSVGFTASANGGSATPSHTANAHSLIGNAHTHTFSAANTSGTNTLIDEAVSGRRWYTIEPPPLSEHNHASVTSNSTTITYQNATPTVGAASDEPPHITVIVIKPDDANQDIPDDAVCFTDDITLPGGDFEKYAAADGRFYKGAAAGSGGGDTDGSATHDHTSSHTHTVDVHSHAQKTCGTSAGKIGAIGTPADEVMLWNHHRVTLNNKSLTVSSNDGNIAAVNGEPDYVELLGIQNTSGSAAMALGVIIGYIGSEASIPTGWELVSATTDKQIRSTPTDGDVENTGGSNTHDHGTSAAHSHYHSVHNHVAGATIFGKYAFLNTPDLQVAVTQAPHSHTWTVSNTLASAQSNTFTMSTDDGRFPYRTMIFIKRVLFPTVHIKGGAIKGGVIL